MSKPEKMGKLLTRNMFFKVFENNFNKDESLFILYSNDINP